VLIQKVGVMSLMRDNLLANLHLSRLSLAIDSNHLRLIKKGRYTISISSDPKSSFWVSPFILAVISGSTVKALNLGVAVTPYFLTSSFRAFSNLYFSSFMPIISDLNSAKAAVAEGRLDIDLGLCTNFYNAYENIAWFAYAGKPMLQVSLVSHNNILLSSRSKYDLLFILAYLNYVV